MEDDNTSPEAPETQKQDQPTDLHTRLQWKCLDFGWIIFTWPGRFKAAEFLTTFLGFVLVASVNAFDKETSYEFFVFVGIFSWVVICLHVCLGIPHLIEKLPQKVTQPFVFLVCCSIAALTWLITSSIIADKGKGEVLVEAGAVFGFITTILFVLEAIYYFVMWRQG